MTCLGLWSHHSDLWEECLQISFCSVLTPASPLHVQSDFLLPPSCKDTCVRMPGPGIIQDNFSISRPLTESHLQSFPICVTYALAPENKIRIYFWVPFFSLPQQIPLICKIGWVLGILTYILSNVLTASEMPPADGYRLRNGREKFEI